MSSPATTVAADATLPTERSASGVTSVSRESESLSGSGSGWSASATAALVMVPELPKVSPAATGSAESDFVIETSADASIAVTSTELIRARSRSIAGLTGSMSDDSPLARSRPVARQRPRLR
jgi:hypothetical protein